MRNFMMQRRVRPMLADGRGQRTARERQAASSRRKQAELEVRLTLESERPKFKAPDLSTLKQIQAVVDEAPTSPIYTISTKSDITKIGKAVFGEHSYNRVKRESSGSDIGPHFDAYAAHFSPWTIHRNVGRVGIVRAMFLPDELWREYIESTNGLSDLDAAAQRERFSIGRELFAEGRELTIGKLGNDTLTLLWHGDVSRPDLPSPSVHEFSGVPSLISGRIQVQGTYDIYARQHTPGNFDGFIEV